MRIAIYLVCICLISTSAYSGEWIADKQTGCKVWNDSPKPGESITWSGKCEDGKANGKGTLKFHDNNKKGNIYICEFKNGKPIGHGVLFTPDGLKNEGEFKDGEPFGLVTTTLPNGSKIVSEEKDDKIITRAVI